MLRDVSAGMSNTRIITKNLQTIIKITNPTERQIIIFNVVCFLVNIVSGKNRQIISCHDVNLLWRYGVR